MEDWLHPLLRALNYALLLGLFGLTAFPHIGLRNIDDAPAGRSVTILAILAPLVSVALMLVATAAMMGQPVWSLEWSVVQEMISTTTMGWAFALRATLLMAAMFFMRSRTLIAAVLYGLAIATLPWSGHAAAGEGMAGNLHRANDAVHLLASGLWFGAIGWFTWLAASPHRNSALALPLLRAMHRFAPLGVALVVMVTLTGLVNAQLIFGLGSSWTMLSSAYGQLLAGKVVLFGLMLLCAARHANMARKAALTGEQATTDRSTVLSAIRTSLIAELVLGFGVISAAAVLGLLSPMVE